MGSHQSFVAVVDDDPAVCSVISRGLTTREVPHRTTTDPAEARGWIHRGRLDVLVTDVRMNPITGLELLADALRGRESSNPRVILMTGWHETDLLADAIRLGAYDYLLKPFDLWAMVETVLRARRGRGRSLLPRRAAEAMFHPGRDRSLPGESVEALIQAVEAKDPHTRRHAEQVSSYAAALARRAGLDSRQGESFRIAALLHDVGKIGIPEGILAKPGRLDASEMGRIRLHPRLGEGIVGRMSAYRREASLVRHHHENWDGSGYPDGLRGEAIPLGSRIIKLADCIDAMLMARSYKPAFSVQRTLDEIGLGRGTAFDPDLAELAMEWMSACPDQLFRDDPGGTLSRRAG